MRMSSQRQLRVGEEIRHALSDVLKRDEVRDPELIGKLITVTEVRISPDLKNATAYVVPLGGIGDILEITAALNRIMPFIRHRVAQNVRLRNAPKLLFKPDTTFDEANHINDLLNLSEVARDLKKNKDNGT